MKFVVLGKYSNQGLAGFVKNPSDNRGEAAKKITEAAGGKLLDMMTLRGAYDFIAIIEASDFETMAGMKMLMQSTGTIEDMNIMEAVDFNKAAEKAAKHCLVIDNSSFYRMDPDVPLIVPQVNSNHLDQIKKNIIANPIIKIGCM